MLTAKVATLLWNNVKRNIFSGLDDFFLKCSPWAMAFGFSNEGVAQVKKLKKG